MKLFVLITIAGLTLTPLPLAEAKQGCSHMAECCSMHSGHSGKKAEPRGLEEMLSAKADFITGHQQEIGLTDEKAAAIRKLEMEAKKNCITKDAEVDVVYLDIEEAMKAYPVDDKMLAGLIAQKYELKKEKALGVAEAYGKIKNSLNREQYEMLKTMWKEEKNGSNRCPLSSGKHADKPAVDSTKEDGKPIS